MKGPWVVDESKLRAQDLDIFIGRECGINKRNKVCHLRAVSRGHLAIQQGALVNNKDKLRRPYKDQDIAVILVQVYLIPKPSPSIFTIRIFNGT